MTIHVRQFIERQFAKRMETTFVEEKMLAWLQNKNRRTIAAPATET
jgi:hypothetical protein